MLCQENIADIPFIRQCNLPRRHCLAHCSALVHRHSDVRIIVVTARRETEPPHVEAQAGDNGYGQSTGEQQRTATVHGQARRGFSQGNGSCL